jgi:hypothetical protein
LAEVVPDAVDEGYSRHALNSRLVTLEFLTTNSIDDADTFILNHGLTSETRYLRFAWKGESSTDYLQGTNTLDLNSLIACVTDADNITGTLYLWLTN